MKPSKSNFKVHWWAFFLKAMLVTTTLGFAQEATGAEIQGPQSHVQPNSIMEDLGQKPVIFVPPPGEGTPSRTVGGASRAGWGKSRLCPEDWSATRSATNPLAESLVALVPPDAQDGPIPLTTSSHPAFFFYMPEMSVEEAFFVIRGEDGNYDYSQTIVIPDQPGVVKISLPEGDANALEVDESYRWSLVLKCGGELRLENPLVRGWVKRVSDPILNSQLPQEDLLEQAILYGENGIWYDTLAQLAASIQTEDASITQWSSFLEAMGLDEIAEEALID